MLGRTVSSSCPSSSLVVMKLMMAPLLLLPNDRGTFVAPTTSSTSSQWINLYQKSLVHSYMWHLPFLEFNLNQTTANTNVFQLLEVQAQPLLRSTEEDSACDSPAAYDSSPWESKELGIWRDASIHLDDHVCRTHFRFFFVWAFSYDRNKSSPIFYNKIFFLFFLLLLLLLVFPKLFFLSSSCWTTNQEDLAGWSAATATHSLFLLLLLPNSLKEDPPGRYPPEFTQPHDQAEFYPKM